MLFRQLLDRDDFDRGWGCQFIRTIAALAAQADRSQDSTHFGSATTIGAFLGAKLAEFSF